MILQRLRVLDHLADHRIALGRLLQLRLLLQRLIQRDVQFGGHQVRQALALGGRQAHHARHILHRGLRLQATERDDLRHVPVLLSHVIQHATAAILTDVHVDIGVFASIGVGEALEQQTEALRTRVRQAQHVAHHRAHAAAAGQRRNAVAPGPRHEVPHDQEVRRDALVGQHLQLALQARTDGRRDAVGTVAPQCAGLGQFAQRVVALLLRVGAFLVGGVRSLEGLQLEAGAERVEPLRGLRRIELRRLANTLHAHQRRMTLALGQLHIAARRDAHRVLDRLRHVGEQFRHLRRVLHVQLLAVDQAIGRILGLLHRDAAQRVMRVMIFLAQEVRVVVAHQRQLQLGGELAHQRIDAPLLLDVPLQLQIEARLALGVLAETLRVPLRLLARGGPRLRVLRARELGQPVRDARTQVAVDRDDALAPLLQRAAIHARLVVEAVQEGVRAQLHQVAPALQRLGQQHQVKPAVRDAVGLAIAAITGRHIGLDAQDGFHACGACRLVELHRRMQVAVIGHRHRIHAERLHPRNQRIDLVATIEQAVLAVQMQVDERGVGNFRHERPVDLLGGSAA